MSLRNCFLILVLLSLCALLSSCEEKVKTLTIGIIPLKAEEEMIEEYEPIQNYLEEKLSIPVKILVMDNYSSLVKEMENKNIDIGYYGAFSYIAAESEMELTPLIVEQRKDAGTYYQSLIITSSESHIKTFDDLKGKKFAFVDSGSTSGYVLPYALFKSRNIELGEHFSKIHYSGSHGQVPQDIKNTIVDAGAISSVQYNELINDGIIIEEDYSILWKSDEIPNSPFVARSELDQNLQQQFVEAMLNIHNEIPNELIQFDSMLEKYVKIQRKDYNSIRNIATILGRDFMVESFLNNE